jgi:hypothetical protein
MAAATAGLLLSPISWGFTYVHADAISGRFPAPGLVKLLTRLRRIGEAWTLAFTLKSCLAILHAGDFV